MMYECFAKLSLCMSFGFSFLFCSDFLPFCTQCAFQSLFWGGGGGLRVVLCWFSPRFTSKLKVIKMHTNSLDSPPTFSLPLQGHSAMPIEAVPPTFHLLPSSPPPFIRVQAQFPYSLGKSLGKTLGKPVVCGAMDKPCCYCALGWLTVAVGWLSISVWPWLFPCQMLAATTYVWTTRGLRQQIPFCNLLSDWQATYSVICDFFSSMLAHTLCRGGRGMDWDLYQQHGIPAWRLMPSHHS